MKPRTLSIYFTYKFIDVLTFFDLIMKAIYSRRLKNEVFSRSVWLQLLKIFIEKETVGSFGSSYRNISLYSSGPNFLSSNSILILSSTSDIHIHIPYTFEIFHIIQQRFSRWKDRIYALFRGWFGLNGFSCSTITLKIKVNCSSVRLWVQSTVFVK